MRKNTKTSKAVKAPALNPVISHALAPIDANVHLGLDRLPGGGLVQSVQNEKDFALEGISKRYVLGRTKSGRLTGTVENFGEFVMRNTIDTQHPHGRVVSEKHQASVLKLQPQWGKLEVVSSEEKKALSLKLDAVRKSFYAELKPAAIALHMDSRTEFRRLKMVRTKQGISLTSTAIVKAPASSNEERLNAENAELRKRLAALESIAAPAAVAKAKKQVSSKPIDVGGTATPTNPETPAEVAQAQPIVAPKGELVEA